MKAGLPALTLLLGACADGSDTGIGEDLDERACAFVGVAGMTIAAASTLAYDSLAIIEPGDEPWTVTLQSAATNWLRFDIAAPTHLRLYVDQPGVVHELMREHEPMGLPATSPVTACAEDIPAHFLLNLDRSGSYHLELQASEVGELWLMLMEPGA